MCSDCVTQSMESSWDTERSESDNDDDDDDDVINVSKSMLLENGFALIRNRFCFLNEREIICRQIDHHLLLFVCPPPPSLPPSSCFSIVRRRGKVGDQEAQRSVAERRTKKKRAGSVDVQLTYFFSCLLSFTTVAAAATVWTNHFRPFDSSSDHFFLEPIKRKESPLSGQVRTNQVRKSELVPHPFTQSFISWANCRRRRKVFLWNFIFMHFLITEKDFKWFQIDFQVD